MSGRFENVILVSIMYNYIVGRIFIVGVFHILPHLSPCWSPTYVQDYKFA